MLPDPDLVVGWKATMAGRCETLAEEVRTLIRAHPFTRLAYWLLRRLRLLP